MRMKSNRMRSEEKLKIKKREKNLVWHIVALFAVVFNI